MVKAVELEAGDDRAERNKTKLLSPEGLRRLGIKTLQCSISLCLLSFIYFYCLWRSAYGSRIWLPGTTPSTHVSSLEAPRHRGKLRYHISITDDVAHQGTPSVSRAAGPVRLKRWLIIVTRYKNISCAVSGSVIVRFLRLSLTFQGQRL
jgi:hypothetical protein